MRVTEITYLRYLLNKSREKIIEIVYYESMFFKFNVYSQEERRHRLDNVLGALMYAYAARIIHSDEYHDLMDQVIEAWESNSTDNKTPKPPKAKSAER